MLLRKYGGRRMNEDKDELDQFFDDENVNKLIKRSKFKQKIKMVTICVSVICVLMLMNAIICMRMHKQINDKIESEIVLSVPNGYVSDVDTKVGIFNVRTDYTISKNLLYKNIELEKNFKHAGWYYRSTEMHRWYIEGENKWNNGSRKMIFFHPKLQYSTYQNEIELFQEMPRGQVAELGLSFDKAYTWEEIQALLEEYPIQWLWIDTYNDENLEEMQNKINQAQTLGILEDEVIGINLWDIEEETNYKSVIKALKQSKKQQYKEAYQVMNERKYNELENTQFIGAIIIADEKEAAKLSEYKWIKAISVGTTANKY